MTKAINVRRDPSRDVLLMNLASLTELGLTAEQAEQITTNGWDIVNAPRPLNAVWKDANGYQIGITWEGPCIHGIHYAAGDAWELAKEWHAMDAWPLRPTTNEQVEARIRAMLAEEGVTLEAILTDGYFETVGELADYYNLPWRD